MAIEKANDLETIEINDIELELICNKICKYEYPVVYVGNYTIYFNRFFGKLIKKNTNRIKYFTTPQYVIITEIDGEKVKDTFKLLNSSYETYITTYPSLLREKKIRKGAYKIYRCKQGFAFNRYEPIEV